MKALVVLASRLEFEAAVDALATPGPTAPLMFGPIAGVTLTRPGGDVAVIAGGVGVAACAASTATVLATAPFDLVLSIGIGGGAAGYPIGSVVVGDATLAADLGCETEDAFLPLSGMGLGVDRFDVAPRWSKEVATRIERLGLTVQIAAIATVSTITGTARRAAEHQLRHGAAAEAMEGFAVASAAALHDIPFVEVRVISNAIGPRDVTQWRLQETVALLGPVVETLFTEAWPW